MTLPRGWRAGARGLGSALLVAAMLTAPGAIAPAASAVTTYDFGNSWVDGAGFQNTIAVSPFLDDAGRRPALIGADAFIGFHRSFDGGATWERSTNGLEPEEAKRIASIVWSPTTPGKVYAAAGPAGYFLRSTDWGTTWEVRSGVPTFVAENAEQQPRPVGNLIAAAGTTLWAGTYSSGVMRSTDDGLTWQTIADLGAGVQVRSLVVNPSNPDLLYAGTTAGTFRITKARSAAVVTPLGGPPRAEEVAVLDTMVYVVAGASGVWSWDNAAGTWKQLAAAQLAANVLPNAQPPNQTVWASIAAYRKPNGVRVIYAGAANPAVSGVYRSLDGGQNFSPVMGTGRFSTDVVGTGQPWWLMVSRPNLGPNGRSFVASQVVVSPGDPGVVFVAGRGGVWRSTNAEANDTTISWAPSVRGQAATVTSDVAVDPTTPGRAFVANTDWTFLASGDGLRTVRQRVEPGFPNAGYAVGLDTGVTPARVYLAAGDRDLNEDGALLTNADPGGGAAWSAIPLPAGLTQRVKGVGARTVAGVTTVLIAVEGQGVFRRTGTADWVRTAVTLPGPVRKAVPVVFGRQAGLVYVHDERAVWRSSDSGVTWTKILTRSSVLSGRLSLDPGSEARLYLSNADGVYRIEAPLNSATATATLLPGTAGAQAVLAASGDRLFVTTISDGGTPARVLLSTDRGATFSVVSDQAYAAADLTPTTLALDSSGALLVGSASGGVFQGVP